MESPDKPVERKTTLIPTAETSKSTYYNGRISGYSEPNNNGTYFFLGALIGFIIGIFFMKCTM